MIDVRSVELIKLIRDVMSDIAERTNGKYTGVRTVQLVATLLDQAFGTAAASA